MRFSLRRFAAVAAASVAIILSSCSSGPLKHADWAPDVRSALNDFIRTYGNGPQKEYVVFDFDNTTSIFDISEQLMIYQLETMSFGLTPQEFVEAVVEPEADAPQPVREKVAELAADYEALYERFGHSLPQASPRTQCKASGSPTSGNHLPSRWVTCMTSFRIS
ncbi:MAG: hypothetical protein KBS78_06065 [Bacteroidales bacterium]|nr:hypothetical protein [Candidatus Cryptobacteroides faecihippi]